MFDITTSLVTLAICLPAAILASQRSPWIVDYLFFVVALNRGIRRIVDYNNGYFNQYSFISLTPIIVGGFAVFVVLAEHNGRSNSLSRSTLRAIYCYGFATALAFVVGFINIGFGAVYALGDYIAPIGLIGFGALHAHRDDILDRWCNSVALSGLVVAVYGIWQFYTIPPWDAFWVRSVSFEGYLGELEPTKMTLFSTMSDRGPAATYLCGCLILVALRPKTLGPFRWPAAAVILLAMLLTYSRTTVIQASLAAILFPLLNRGAGGISTTTIVILFLLFGETLLQNLPGSGMAGKRVATIGSIQDDGSFIGRMMLLKIAASQSLSEPLGLGLGSHGLASRVSTGMATGITDSTGYVEALRTYGWLGFLLIAYVFWLTWRATRVVLAAGLTDSNLFLFRAWYISGLVAAFSGSWFFTATFFWVLAGYCLAKADEVEESLDDYSDLEGGMQSSATDRESYTLHAKP